MTAGIERGNAEDSLEDAARELIGRARAQSQGPVLLDLEVDGARYRLTRIQTLDGRGEGLSPRELEIANLVARGEANKTIARALQISSWTVNTHLRRAFGKLKVTSRAAMVARLNDAGASLEPNRAANTLAD